MKLEILSGLNERQRLAVLRTTRKKLLKAFDIWEKAVLRGRESDDPEIMQWYQNLLDLKEEAFTETPKQILYYTNNG